jgi:DNA polymerase III alpha subunit
VLEARTIINAEDFCDTADDVAHGPTDNGIDRTGRSFTVACAALHAAGNALRHCNRSGRGKRPTATTVFKRIANIVLFRPKPGSAKGVMFITIEDESGVANIVIWPWLCERQRRVILGACMISVKGRVQREGDIVHLVANHLTDMSTDPAGIGTVTMASRFLMDEATNSTMVARPTHGASCRKGCGPATSKSRISTSTASR